MLDIKRYQNVSCLGVFLSMCLVLLLVHETHGQANQTDQPEIIKNNSAFYIHSGLYDDFSAQRIRLESTPDSVISLIFSQHRSLEVLPCGCSIIPYGGIDREFNLLQQWRSNDPGQVVINLTSGTTFTPQIVPPNPSREFVDIASKKAVLLMKGLEALELNAVSIGSYDLRLGKEFLDQIQNSSAIPFVNANILYRGKPYFDPYIVFQVGKVQIVVIGLSGSANSELESGFEVVHPKRILPALMSKVFEEVTPDALIVFSSSVTEDVMIEVLDQFPHSHILAGTGPLECVKGSVGGYSQHSDKSLFLSPQPLGTELIRINLPLQTRYRQFYGNGSGRARYGIEYWKKESESLVEQLDFASGEQRKEIDRQLLAAKRRQDAMSTVPINPSPQTVIYKIDSERISGEYSHQDNAVSSIVSEFSNLPYVSK